MTLSLFRRRASSAPDGIEVTHEGKVYQVRLRPRATVRRLTLRISSATGEVVLTMPENAQLRHVRRFADAHAAWIAERLLRMPEKVVFAPGAVIPLRGEPHRIVHWSSVRGPVEATADAQGAIIAVTGDAAHLPRRVRDFLQAQARKDLSAAVARHTAVLGIPARSISLRDTRSRWGSCSAAGRLNFSWRLILAPPLVLDYLAAHEVAHLRELNHSDRFWRLTHSLCPATAQAEAWLKRHGSSLHWYG